MDIQDIPVLTEVYKTKPTKVAQEKDQVSPEVLTSLVEELRVKIKAELTSELTAEIGEKLKQELLHGVSDQVSQNDISNLRGELLAEISHASETVSALEKYLDQTVVNALAVEKDLIKKNEGLIELSKSELSEKVNQLSADNAERINSEVSAKLVEAQELAVIEAKTQIADNLNTIEGDFKGFVAGFLEDTKNQLAQALNESLQTNKATLAQLSQELEDAVQAKQVALGQFNQELAGVVEANKAALSQLSQELDDSVQTKKATLSQLKLELAEAVQTNKAMLAQLSQELDDSVQVKKATLSQLDLEFDDMVKTRKNTLNQLNQSFDEAQQANKAALSEYLETSKNQFLTDIGHHQQTFESAVSSFTETTKNSLISELEDRQKSFDSTINLMVDELYVQMKEELESNVKGQLTEFIQNAMEKKKQTSVEELNRFYQEHTKQSQDNFAHRTQVVNQELMDAVSAHSQKLLLETNEALAVSQQTLLAEAKANALSQLSVALSTMVDEKRESFKMLIKEDVPAVEKVISERFNHLLSSELPVFEEGLMIKVKTSITQALQSIKLVVSSDK